MPLYEYEHTGSGEGCSLGKNFELRQTLYAAKFTSCPECGRKVRRLISLVGISTPKTNADLKNLGFTKLVKRDDGVYENVTATGGESKIWDARKPGTMPNLKGKISD